MMNEADNMMKDDAMMEKKELTVLEGTIIAILEDEFLFVAQLNLSKELLEKTSDEWLASDRMSELYRLTGIGSDINVISVGTEIRISFAITTMSIPPLVPVVDYEIITKDEEVVNETNLDLSVLEGTIVAISKDEFLFVAQLNLSEEMLKRTPDEWFKSDQMSELYRLTNNGSDISVGTEIRISFAITTMSIPPLVPQWNYEIIEN